MVKNLTYLIGEENTESDQLNKGRLRYTEVLIQLTYPIHTGFPLYAFGFSPIILRQRPDTLIISKQFKSI
jgi:hypothetical protein